MYKSYLDFFNFDKPDNYNFNNCFIYYLISTILKEIFLNNMSNISNSNSNVFHNMHYKIILYVGKLI